MDRQFTLLAQEADMLCRDYFGKRLAACYLHGSIAMGDAIAGISDLDYYVVLSESLTEEDCTWLCNTKEQLEGRYAICPEVHLAVCTVDELKGNSFARFALKYNAQRMSGADVLSSLENDGYPVPLPDAAMAKGKAAGLHRRNSGGSRICGAQICPVFCGD